ncbi:hypothetical protein GGR77_002004 [Xanthomonas translucens]|uniref:hypothetical protein n=1 Tax=Xanthomonas medicagonis TaxID=3160841 RepID=UPI00161243AD
MAYWRMQLHPNEPAQAVSYVAKALGLGFIGLDFADPPGDLTDVDPSAIEKTQRDYWDFAHKMAIGDVVLVSAHHYPFALVEVTGHYNYIRSPEELEVWFRHFRRVSVLGYYADLVTNPKNWEKITMTDTISILNDPKSKSFQLISFWLEQPTAAKQGVPRG